MVHFFTMNHPKNVSMFHTNFVGLFLRLILGVVHPVSFNRISINLSVNFQPLNTKFPSISTQNLISPFPPKFYRRKISTFLRLCENFQFVMRASSFSPWWELRFRVWCSVVLFGARFSSPKLAMVSLKMCFRWFLWWCLESRHRFQWEYQRKEKFKAKMKIKAAESSFIADSFIYFHWLYFN